MDFYSSNMEMIKKARKSLYDEIISYLDNRVGDEDDIISKSEMSKDGHLVLSIEKDGKQYRMNSRYRPLQETKTWIRQFNFNNFNIVISMFGFGNGYFIRELKNKLKEDDKLLVLEPSEAVFIHTLNHYDIRDILDDKQIYIFLGKIGGGQLYHLLGGVLHWSNLNSHIECKHPQYGEIFSEGNRQFNRAVDDNKERVIVNRNTEVHFSQDIIENLTANMKFVPGSNYLEEIKGLWDDDIPVIIVSAGPSLDINVEELKKAKGKAVILATDTALRVLYKHGIEPDITITIDPRKWVGHFQDVGFEKTHLICGTNANRVVMNQHIGKKIWCNCHTYIVRIYQKMGKEIPMWNTGGSVATTAFNCARTLGAKRIILIGQDLAYKGDYTHAGAQVKGIPYEEQSICSVEGIDGNQIKSRFDWQYYLKWYEKMIEGDSDANIVIDATEGGAKIKGTKIMTLKEAIRTYCVKPINVQEILNGLTPTFDHKNIEKFVEYLERDVSDLSNIVKKTRESVGLCNKAMKEYKIKKMITPSIEKNAMRISKNNKEMVNTNIYFMAEELMKKKSIKMLQTINDISDNEYENVLNTYGKQKQMMIDLKESAEELLPFLQDCIKELSNNSEGKNVTID